MMNDLEHCNYGHIEQLLACPLPADQESRLALGRYRAPHGLGLRLHDFPVDDLSWIGRAGPEAS